MGEKDISGETLESYNKVFPDIVNVLFFYEEQDIHSVLQLLNVQDKDCRFGIAINERNQRGAEQYLNA